MRATTSRASSAKLAGRAIRLLPAALLLPVLAATAAPRATQVRFSVQTELQSAGLKLRIPPGLSETPLPSPSTQLYQITDRNGARVVECLDPHELWRTSQIEAMWSDTKGVAFMLATVRTEMPSVDTQVLPKDAALAAIAKATAPTNWAADRLTQWVATFTSRPVSSSSVIQRPPSGIREARIMTLGGGEVCGVLFRPYITVSLRRTESPQLLFAWIRVPPGGDADTVIAALRDEFLPSVSAVKPNEDAVPQADTRFQNRRVWDKSKATAELEASRKRVADSIRNLRDWWYAGTPHYVLLSNLPSRNRQVVKEMQTRMEGYRSMFEEVFPPKTPISDVSVIRVLATDSEYDAYVGTDYTWTTGIWLPQRHELVVRPIRDELQREEKDRFLQVVAHEAFHQYVSATIEPATPGPWFNEGHAELFAQASLDRDRLIVSESPLYTPVLEKMARSGKLDAGKLITMSYAQFYAGEKDAVALNYATAWGLVYFLHKSAAADQKSPFRDLLSRYRKELSAQQDGKPPAAGVASKIDVQALNRELNAFWDSNGRRQSAKRTPILAYPP